LGEKILRIREEMWKILIADGKNKNIKLKPDKNPQIPLEISGF